MNARQANEVNDKRVAELFESAKKMIQEESYDIVFNDENDSNNKGFELTIDECKDYIRTYNGTNESYFADYKGGTVSIVSNSSGNTVYYEGIKNE